MKLLALLAASTLASTGCATVFAREQISVPVASRVPGAAISLDGIPAGATPSTLRMDAHKPHVIVVSGAGGAGSCRLDPGVGAGWVALDFMLGVWPVVIDLVTGDWATADDGACFVPV